MKAVIPSIILKVPHAVSGYDYLTGFRGFLAIQSFIWVFLTTFVPAAVNESQTPDGPQYQVLLRKVVSVLFWNESLIYSAIILLSGRTVCLPFLQAGSVKALASSVFRRTASLLLPVAVSLAVTATASSQIGNAYIDAFKSTTGNKSITTPYPISNSLIYFNSLFTLFWTTQLYTAQAASVAFPSGLIWVLSVVYQQSYTVYVAVLTIPYTRPAWRVQGFALFVLAAFWVQSWAWYSMTGLLLADAVHNMNFKARSARGIKIWRSIRLPSFILYLVLMAAGLAMQYLWVAWRPQFENKELIGHTGLYYTGGLNTDYTLAQPQARDDIYLIVLGFCLILETSTMLQWIFSTRVFMSLGRRSYC
jgi:hypothetical protein